MKMQQTILKFWAVLLLLSLSTSVFSQDNPELESALDEIEEKMDDIATLNSKAQKLIPELQVALEDADFRSTKPLFRKLHLLLDGIEANIYAISSVANRTWQLDPRVDVSAIQEACIFLSANEDFAALALMDVAAAMHEGDLALAEDNLEEAETALRGIQFLLDNAAQDVRDLERSF